ncbi:bifunctional folylpolyglutamate synthase/dihydrofolate synthase [Sphingomonas ginkgonis]|uniref:tetrahydrofolate synthase n=2 Tax=Sphingomonas ginkgonis TaxID=2315330 RepID=A0A429VA80_9SPHN|nr:folylpolyglutamate synthase/dihydrofolate synthase family protein [Sphingomonas ginkgonis]RST30891.1 bifunctional folylpolyglutamate synthase/dihydrofolate synthase [Sphingomonas ginkgonis]
MDFATSTHAGVQFQLDRLAMPGGGEIGLATVRALLDRLGRPQDRLPPVFHVAGTNGKGSTCAFLRAALEASGRRVHVFTSPHLVRFNERIRVAGRLIDDATLEKLLARVIDTAEEVGLAPSFFEAAVAVAFLAFAETPADATILEVGLGGRLDATNVVERPLVTGIASLGLDHQAWLGKSLADIAGEKAGIARRGVPLVTQRYPAAAAERVQAVAITAGADWRPRGPAWDVAADRGRLRYRDDRGTLTFPPPSLPGRHQALNAALALAMLRHQHVLPVDDYAFTTAMAGARWPARMQRLGDGPLARGAPGRELWLDGGHNPAASRAIVSELRRRFSDGRPLELLFASLRTKDARGVLAPFRGLASQVWTLTIPGHDSRPAGELAAMAQHLGFAAEPAATLPDALARTTSGARILIFGSLYLAGEVLAANGEFPD